MTIARSQGLFLSEEQLALDNQLVDDRLAPQELVFIAEGLGMRARTVKIPAESLHQLRKACPIIVTLRSGGAMVLTEVMVVDDAPRVVRLIDPYADASNTISMDVASFEQAWTGELIVVKRRYQLFDEEQPFSLRFIGSLVFGEKIIRDLAISAFLMGAFSLVPIAYYRILNSTVIPLNAMNTWVLITVVTFWSVVMMTVLSYIRQYMVSVITVRVDVKIYEFMFDRILKLPVDFFERTQVGEITFAVNEAMKIRNFMAGELLGTVLDSTLLIFFLPTMFYVSWLLTSIVVATMLVMMVVIVLMLPSIKQSIGQLIRAQVARGSFLYQTLAGIRTVKSLALEARQRGRWDALVAEVARRDLEVTRVANRMRAILYPLEQFAMTGVFGFGAYYALATKDLSMAANLFVFLMLSQKVIAPLMNLAKLVEQFDEARSAVTAVSNVVNRPQEENAGERGVRKPLVGNVSFAKLRFKYPGAQVPALDDVSFEIPVGTTLGIVGRSGSGKTTVTRLLQRLHSEYEGLIKIDGVDIREYDLQHLRRSLGVVLQENFLFSGTIRENIVAAKPGASFDEVVNACRLAGAEEFIDRLPKGYDTHIYEGSPNLSGGQRQRLAIARALILDPRILILDEATSALDPDSEAIVNENLRRIAEGRTMLVISHRLSSLVNSDAILVLERGRFLDLAPHKELLNRCDIYQNLWNQQNRHAAPDVARQNMRGPSRVS